MHSRHSKLLGKKPVLNLNLFKLLFMNWLQIIFIYFSFKFITL